MNYKRRELKSRIYTEKPKKEEKKMNLSWPT